MKVLALSNFIDLANVDDRIIDDCGMLQYAQPNDMEAKQWLPKLASTPSMLQHQCHCPRYPTIHPTVHPQSPTQQDDADMTALHIVWAGHSNVQTVFYALYEANPAAMFIRDIYGSTPLDYLNKEDGRMSLIVDLMQDLCVHRVKKVNAKRGQKRKKNGSNDTKN